MSSLDDSELEEEFRKVVEEARNTYIPGIDTDEDEEKKKTIKKRFSKVDYQRKKPHTNYNRESGSEKYQIDEKTDQVNLNAKITTKPNNETEYKNVKTDYFTLLKGPENKNKHKQWEKGNNGSETEDELENKTTYNKEETPSFGIQRDFFSHRRNKQNLHFNEKSQGRISEGDNKKFKSTIKKTNDREFSRNNLDDNAKNNAKRNMRGSSSEGEKHKSYQKQTNKNIHHKLDKRELNDHSGYKQRRNSRFKGEYEKYQSNQKETDNNIHPELRRRVFDDHNEYKSNRNAKFNGVTGKYKYVSKKTKKNIYPELDKREFDDHSEDKQIKPPSSKGEHEKYSSYNKHTNKNEYPQFDKKQFNDHDEQKSKGTESRIEGEHEKYSFYNKHTNKNEYPQFDKKQFNDHDEQKSKGANSRIEGEHEKYKSYNKNVNKKTYPESESFNNREYKHKINVRSSSNEREYRKTTDNKDDYKAVHKKFESDSGNAQRQKSRNFKDSFRKQKSHSERMKNKYFEKEYENKAENKNIRSVNFRDIESDEQYENYLKEYITSDSSSERKYDSKNTYSKKGHHNNNDDGFGKTFKDHKSFSNNVSKYEKQGRSNERANKKHQTNFHSERRNEREYNTTPKTRTNYDNNNFENKNSYYGKTRRKEYKQSSSEYSSSSRTSEYSSSEDDFENRTSYNQRKSQSGFHSDYNDQRRFNQKKKLRSDSSFQKKTGNAKDYYQRTKRRDSSSGNESEKKKIFNHHMKTRRDASESESSRSSSEESDSELRIVRRKEWGAPKSKWGSGASIKKPVSNVFVLPTNLRTCYNKEDCVKEMRFLIGRHMKTLLCPDIKYNFLIGGDGRVYEGRGWNTRPGLPKEHQEINKFSIFIGLIGRFTENYFPRIMREARDKLIIYGIAEKHIDEDYVLCSSVDKKSAK